MTFKNKLIIRKAKKEDLKEVGKIMKQEFAKPPFNETASNKEIIKSLEFYNKIGKIYVAEIDKKIIGILVFKIEQYWKELVLIIEDLAVKQKFKKQNIGKKLMEFTEEYAKKNKIKSITFMTHSRSKAINFYKKLGYKINKNIISMSKKIK